MLRTVLLRKARKSVCGRMKLGTCKTGEQGEPFMPLLFALGLHWAFSAVRARLRDGVKVFVFLTTSV